MDKFIEQLMGALGASYDKFYVLELDGSQVTTYEQTRNEKGEIMRLAPISVSYLTSEEKHVLRKAVSSLQLSDDPEKTAICVPGGPDEKTAESLIHDLQRYTRAAIGAYLDI